MRVTTLTLRLLMRFVTLKIMKDVYKYVYLYTEMNMTRYRKRLFLTSNSDGQVGLNHVCSSLIYYNGTRYPFNFLFRVRGMGKFRKAHVTMLLDFK